MRTKFSLGLLITIFILGSLPIDSRADKKVIAAKPAAQAAAAHPCQCSGASVPCYPLRAQCTSPNPSNGKVTRHSMFQCGCFYDEVQKKCDVFINQLKETTCDAWIAPDCAKVRVPSGIGESGVNTTDGQLCTDFYNEGVKSCRLVEGDKKKCVLTDSKLASLGSSVQKLNTDSSKATLLQCVIDQRNKTAVSYPPRFGVVPMDNCDPKTGKCEGKCNYIVTSAKVDGSGRYSCLPGASADQSIPLPAQLFTDNNITNAPTPVCR